MRILFDVMGTVLGALDHSLRPGVRATIDELRVGGHRVAFWTSGHVDEMEAELRRHNIEGTVYSKSIEVDFAPDLCVDDQPEGWMPARVLEVEPHVCSDMPGEPIDTASLLVEAAGEGRADGDSRAQRKGWSIEDILFGKRVTD